MTTTAPPTDEPKRLTHPQSSITRRSITRRPTNKVGLAKGHRYALVKRRARRAGLYRVGPYRQGGTSTTKLWRRIADTREILGSCSPGNFHQQHSYGMGAAAAAFQNTPGVKWVRKGKKDQRGGGGNFPILDAFSDDIFRVGRWSSGSCHIATGRQTLGL